MSRAAAVLAAVALGGCPRAQVDDPRRVDGNDAIIYVDSQPAVAVWIDGGYIGTVAEVARGMAIEPGTHRLELQADGYESEYRVLELTARQRLRLAIELAPVLP
ncbi:MAG: PEGA domain-containing protein [Kofleriaceae bacterium]